MKAKKKERLKGEIKQLAENDTEHILSENEKYDAIFWFKRGAKSIIEKL